MDTYTIVIDSYPMTPRPDYHLTNILVDTGLIIDDFVITGKTFGEWTFVLNHEKNDIYSQVKSIISERIKMLYYMGDIRYGSW